jgi:hypothetical protein
MINIRQIRKNKYGARAVFSSCTFSKINVILVDINFGYQFELVDAQLFGSALLPGVSL